MNCLELRSSHRFPVSLGLITSALLSIFQAHAESPVVTVTEQLYASPDAPVFGFIWRGAPRATLSAALPLVGVAPEATSGLRLTPFVEIHNSDNSTLVIPNQNWRGRLSLEGWRLWRAQAKTEDGPWLRAGVAVTHESDHSSAREDAPRLISSFRMLNDLAVRMAASTSAENTIVLTGELDSRLFFLSCTHPSVDCRDSFNAFGYGGGLELTSQLRLQKGWHAFWSLSFSWIVPSGDLLKELRVVTHLGLWKRMMGGTWQMFVLGYSGNDVGIMRDTSLQQVGLGIRWAP